MTPHRQRKIIDPVHAAQLRDPDHWISHPSYEIVVAGPNGKPYPLGTWLAARDQMLELLRRLTR